jgi:uncharacterized protein (DUF486 family)
MSDLANQLALVAGILLAFAIGPGLAITFLILRRSRIKAARRSPIGIKLLRGPGHTLREQLEEESDNVIWDVMILSVMPLVILSLFLAQAHYRTLDHMLRLAPIYVVLVGAMVAYFVYRLTKRGERLGNLKSGYDAEVAVGQELDLLVRRGALVFHDFPADGFNIDHVVVTPKCVYAVETKGYTKLNKLKGREGVTVEFDGMRLRFPTWTTDEPVLQAERQANWLGDWIKKSTGHFIPVKPVVALPGWFVKEKGIGAVKVFSGKQLSGLLEVPSPQLDPRTQSLVHQLDQRCRTVVPTYKRDGTEKT